MAAKRKFSSCDSISLPAKVTPPAPQKPPKPGKLKSILKPSPPSQFFTPSSQKGPSPSAQIKLELNKATSNANANANANANRAKRTTPPKANAPRPPPRTTKRPKLETHHAQADHQRLPPTTSKKPKPQAPPLKAIPSLPLIMAKDPKLEITPENKIQRRTATQHIPSADPDVDIIEDSAAEMELPQAPLKKSKSPKYDDDGDTEGMVTDSQPTPLDGTHLMSGGLGEGESPYKGSANAMPGTRKRPCDRKIKKKRTRCPKNLNSVNSPPPSALISDVLEQPQYEQVVASELEQCQPIRTVSAKDEEHSIPASGAPELGTAVSKQEPTQATQAKDDDAPSPLNDVKYAPLSTPDNVKSELLLPYALESEKKSQDPIMDGSASPPTLVKTISTQAVPLSAASPKVLRKQRRDVGEVQNSQSPRLADISTTLSTILEDYEAAKNAEVEKLQDAAHAAYANAEEVRSAMEATKAKAEEVFGEMQSLQARNALLETQNGLLRREFELQSKERRLQYTWPLNQFDVFSRRTYQLQSEEETTVMGGSDDLDEVNKIARDLFLTEMSKVESFVEELGQRNSFCVLDSDMPQVQIRMTGCGLLKCRSYQGDSRWDLTVERLGAVCTPVSLGMDVNQL